MPAPLHAPALLHALAGTRLGHPIYLYQQIGSTNDEARHLAEAGAPEGLLVVAEQQHAGRGREGRRWLTPPGAALALSLVLRPAVTPHLAQRLSMLAGVAVCEAIELVAGIPASLKWPNDVLLAGKKAGGILIEASLLGDTLASAVLGLGLNVSAAPPPAEVDFPATHLEAEAGRPVDRLRLLRAILERVGAHYPSLAAGEPASAADELFAAWRGRLGWLGQRVSVRTPGGEVVGLAEDVEPEGALLVRLPGGGLARGLAGDVRLRLVSAED
jgi:BirA family biotin operon repressor/biotin-[acetyl-CoA-carboxylase] ligase